MTNIAREVFKNMDTNEPIKNVLALEYPFVFEGMTHAEFDEEYDYFIHHHKEYINGTYKPLWKQKGEK